MLQSLHRQSHPSPNFATQPQPFNFKTSLPPLLLNLDSYTLSDWCTSKILTQEDWNEVLYNGMANTNAWASLYFVALMTFGNYVLFNLLVAILVEGFSAEVSYQSNSI